VRNLLLRRLAQAIPTLLVIATLTFLLLRLAPGGPFDEEVEVTEEVRARMAAHYGLDQPLAQQYLRFMGNLLRGDMGPSFKYPGWEVHELIAQGIPVSLELGLLAMIVAFALGIPAGIIAALYHRRVGDSAVMFVALLGICLPSFVLAPLLLLVFSSWLGWFQPIGWTTPADRVLPALTLGLFYAAYIARLSRSGMLEVLQQDFIRTARAKGLSEQRVIVIHATRTALYPVVAYLGPAFAAVISGSFVVETIFFLPGLGTQFVNAALNRDYTMVMGTVLFYALLILAFNLLADLIQAWLQPKTRDANG
jgi:oligopeptide transport system permease protein